MADTLSTRHSAPGSPAGIDYESSVLNKVSWRLIPFLFVLYVLNILDRSNIGFAKLTMLKDLNISEEAYGDAAGLFFYGGYVLFEVPSNLMLMRAGARKWIARIMVSWGLVSAAMMLIKGPGGFYALRVLLGVAEAGFFPGIILYLSTWFPAQARARAISRFMIAGMVASIVGYPISGMILDHLSGVSGLAGWQWLFLLEGIPSVLMGVATYFYLTDRPDQATWLSGDEKAWLVDRLDRERKELGPREKHTLAAAFANPRLWLLIGVYFTVAWGDNCFGFFLPTLLRRQFPADQWNATQLGLLAAVPAAVGIVVMLAVSVHSDRTGERRLHVAFGAFTAAVGWLLVAATSVGWLLVPFQTSPWLVLAAPVVTLAGMKAMLPVFWTIPTSFLSGTAAAGGIALINSVANIGGALSPSAMGRLKGEDGLYLAGLQVAATVLAAGGVLVLFARSDAPPAPPPDMGDPAQV